MACKRCTVWWWPNHREGQWVKRRSSSECRLDTTAAAGDTGVGRAEWRFFFSSEPGHTHVMQHEIHMIPGKVIHQRPYRVPEARREAIKEEVRKILKLGIIEESQSA